MPCLILQANRTVSDIQKYTALRWIFSVAIGVMVGLTAFAINIAVENVAGIKFGWTFSLMEYSYFASFIVYTLFNVALVLSSSLLILYFAPAAAGSGIPDVKVVNVYIRAGKRRVCCMLVFNSVKLMRAGLFERC